MSMSTSRRLATTLTALVGAAACAVGSGPPDLALDRSVCDGCGMLISDPSFAAAYRVGERTAVFDDVGCLLDALDRAGLATGSDPAAEAAGRQPATAQVWLLDEQQRWLPADQAVFVFSPALATPMGGGVQALRDRAEAEALSARVGGSIVDSFDALRAERRADRSAAPARGERRVDSR
jgi:nitrous oxide reductase accessory protein NosL